MSNEWATVRLANGNMKYLCLRCRTLWISDFCLNCWQADRTWPIGAAMVIHVDAEEFVRRREAIRQAATEAVK